MAADLKALAEAAMAAATPPEGTPFYEAIARLASAHEAYKEAVNPTTVLALIRERDEAVARAEAAEAALVAAREAGDALHKELLSQVNRLMCATNPTKLKHLGRLAALVEQYEQVRFPCTPTPAVEAESEEGSNG